MSTPILAPSIDFDEWTEQRFYNHLAHLDQVARFAPWPEAETDDRMELGRRVETLAAEVLSERGHNVILTSHKAAYDILAGGLRVEVKAARRYPHTNGGGRYQANVHNRADLLVLACCRGHEVMGWFIIPAAEIGRRRNLAIWSEPEAYAGKWSTFLDRWDIADEAIQAAGPHPAQLTLWNEQTLFCGG